MTTVPATPTAAPAGRTLAHSRMRRAIVRTVEASAAVPQFSVEVEVDAGPVLRLREGLRDVVAGSSVTDLLHLAVARTVADHPLANAAYGETGTLLHDDVHLAFIVESGDGMLTPVIAAAQSLDLAAITARRRDLTARAREGRLRPEELMTGTFTVSNLGAFGVRRFHAMVLPPQSAVLAMGSVGPDRRLSLTLTVDHRVVDGAAAARLLSDLRHHLEDPSWIWPDAPPAPPAAPTPQ